MKKNISQCPDKITSDAELLGMASDPTRLRIMCFMFDRDEACVSEIAEALGMSIAAISHHLQLMKQKELFTTERMGTKICYSLVDNSFTRCIRDFVCTC